MHRQALTTETYRRFTWRTGWDWAEIEFDDAGRVRVLSSFGSWSYRWTHPGGEIRAFLVRLDSGYVRGKFGVDDELDVETTARNARRRILDLRRRDKIDHDKARDEWRLIDEFEDDHNLGAWLGSTRLADAWEEVRHQAPAAWERFWAGPWHHFRRALQADLTLEAKRAGWREVTP